MFRLFNLSCVLILLLSGQAFAQYRTALDALFYPEAQQQVLTYAPENKVHIQFTRDSVEQVLLFYLKLSSRPDWQLIFPSEMEAKAWLQGLKKSGGSPVFMLDLYNSKSKVNYNLTIGAYSGTRQAKAQSIITIYSTRRSISERQGG